MPTIFEAFEAAVSLHRAGRLPEAEQIYRQIVARAPGHADALHMLGMVALESGRASDAIGLVRQAIALVPAQAAFHSNLGEVHRALGQLDEAKDCYLRAIELDLNFAAAHNNLALVLQTEADVAAARGHFERALELLPDYVEAHYNLARLLLLEGDYSRGWHEYEWRMRMRWHASQGMNIPRWDGSPLSGKLLLYAEQGLGDTLQFVRYLPLVCRRAADTIMAVPPALVPILRSSGFENMVSDSGSLPHCHAQCSLLSLPSLFKTNLDTIPQSGAYLRPEPSLVDAWRGRLAGIEGLKIGIAWQGNPVYYSDRFRSVPLEAFEPLARVAGVRLVSLQKQHGTAQLQDTANRLNLFVPEALDTAAGAFMDTAAIMASLDLVITSDTSIAHLAGGLGVPVWVALALSPDWRWLLDRADSPWYPTMRLFRQTRLAQWSDVFARMAHELSKLAIKRTPA